MRILLQRVSQAHVTVGDQVIGEIGNGLLLFVGIAPTDTIEILNKLAEKAVNLRIFEDEAKKMNLSALDINAQVLVVSQFTLYADCKKGRRPGFSQSAASNIAEPMVEQFITMLRELGVSKVASGQFGADMQVTLTNNGPVTIMLDSTELNSMA